MNINCYRPGVDHYCKPGLLGIEHFPSMLTWSYCKSTKFRDRFNFANFAVAYQLNRII